MLRISRWVYLASLEYRAESTCSIEQSIIEETSIGQQVETPGDPIAYPGSTIFVSF